MEKPIKKHLILSAFILIFFSCNIEIGNPEGLPESRSVQTVSFNISGTQPCGNMAQGCASLPMRFNGTAVTSITYEMTAAEFYLANLRLAPNPTATIEKSVDLLLGDAVPLNQPVDGSTVTNTEIGFASATNGYLSPTFRLTGHVSIQTSGSQQRIPLTILFSDPLQIQSLVSQDGAIFTGFVFDASLWFDFRNNSFDPDHITKNLSSGPCADPSAQSCTQHKQMIAIKIGANIAKSVGIKKSARGH